MMNLTIRGFFPKAILVTALAITTMRCHKTTSEEELLRPGLSDENSLKSLTLSGNGTWNPEFNPEVLDYIYTVTDTVDSITLIPKAYSKMSKITINDKECRSHAISAPVPLKAGNKKEIAIQVTAENGEIQKYTIIVVRLAPVEKGDDIFLKSLALSGNGSWDAEFNPEVLIYTYTVTDTIESITVIPETNSGIPKITVNGNECKSNEKSAPILLNVGSKNEITIDITAENGDVRKYIVMVERLAPKSNDNKSDDCSLKSLVLSGNGTWDREFKPEVSNYTYTVPDTVESITITPEANSVMSKIEINGKKCRSYEKSAPIPLMFWVGKNVIVIEVTAENGHVQKYTVIVVRLAPVKKNNNNSLKSLALSGNGTWDREFKPNILNYTYTVPDTVESIAIIPEANSGMSKITINGKKCTSKEKTEPIPLETGIGKNIIFIQVAAENGNVRKYAVIVVRLAPVVKSGENSLKSLAISGNGTWDHEFKPKVLKYTYTVPDSVDSITITPEANSGMSKITINGRECRSNEKSEPIPLETGIGKNVISIQVTAENGDVQKYTIIVTHAIHPAPVVKNNDNTLKSLAMSGNGSWNPEFNPKVLNYTYSVTDMVESITITPEANSRISKITINNNEWKGNEKSTLIPLKVGKNEITIKVTAENGDVRKYTVIVKRPDSKKKKANANLRGIEISMGTKNSKRPIYRSFKKPENTTFDPAVTDYAAVVYAYKSINIKAYADDTSVASIVFNEGTDVTHSNGVKIGSVKLTAGAGKVTKVTITVRGEDGSTVKKYNLAVKLLNADEFFWGIFSPSFAKSMDRWREVVPNPELGTNEIINGYVSGTLHWWVELVNVLNIRGKNNMKFTDYCDGNDNQGTTPVYVLYNDNSGINSQDGFVMNGTTTGNVNTAGNGLQTGIYQLTTPWGDKIGSIGIHYVLKNKQIVVDEDSYTTFIYMGNQYRYHYVDQGDLHYPFTNDYDWNRPWNWKK